MFLFWKYCNNLRGCPRRNYAIALYSKKTFFTVLLWCTSWFSFVLYLTLWFLKLLYFSKKNNNKNIHQSINHLQQKPCSHIPKENVSVGFIWRKRYRSSMCAHGSLFKVSDFFTFVRWNWQRLSQVILTQYHLVAKLHLWTWLTWVILVFK